ncbi:MAG: PQQ-dependent sugar dehydrogenase [Sedimentibacter saalensis]|uniref:Glucose/sorbosone dehydrogenase n=1 Tax=Sedimentibacter saalensis TaxID=130788 RepID=A0A562JFD2_9FIRM|nr:PQQ-dependent sugar dehydrogenase [Sedimentibacter saalensis]MEA5095400.1 PQQ-dependent sugar dehydrogenase [Sedimentibacter saalensis]TWH81565.1 glucose/sorbosone dehydrogenase [Sedimentibacter saalensis]
MKKVNVRLRPIVNNINLPTVIKTAILPGDSMESLFIATQVGEIFYVRNENIRLFLDIRQRIIELGANGGYDERGLLGLAFHPDFYNNGLFYLHYTLAGSQGPGALPGSFLPNPCNPNTLNLKWNNRETNYDHIDTVEEWILLPNGQTHRRRSLLNLRRPFMNHNGVNSLKFSPETKKLILTTGDGGSGYDPFNLSQDIMEVAGKVIEIDVAMSTFMDIPEVTRFDELPESIYRALSVIAKGVRNIPGISFQRYYNQYIKYVGNVGQDLVESIFSFVYYTPIPVTEIIQASSQNRELNQEALINLGWRGWEGDLPTPVIRGCSSNPSLTQETIAYLNEAISTSTGRIHPLTCYYHIDSRPEKFSGSALTGVQPYMGSEIPDLTGCVIFTDFVLRDSQPPSRGVLAYTKIRPDCKENDYGIIEPDYNFYNQSSYYVSLGTNLNQSRLYLGVYGSSNVTDYNKGTIFEIVE